MTTTPTAGQTLRSLANGFADNDITTIELVSDIRLMDLAARMAAREAIQRALDAGHNWTEIAKAMGISRQAVRERYDRTA